MNNEPNHIEKANKQEIIKDFFIIDVGVSHTGLFPNYFGRKLIRESAIFINGYHY